MIDDDAEYEARRQIRTQADADIADFIATLGQDDTGIPPPVSIRTTEVRTNPVEFEPFAFGQQGAGSSPAAGPPPPPVPWACCKPDNSCEMLTAAACADAGGTFHIGLTCGEVDCGGSCPSISVAYDITFSFANGCVGGGCGTDCSVNYSGTAGTCEGCESFPDSPACDAGGTSSAILYCTSTPHDSFPSAGYYLILAYCPSLLPQKIEFIGTSPYGSFHYEYTDSGCTRTWDVTISPV